MGALRNAVILCGSRCQLDKASDGKSKPRLLHHRKSGLAVEIEKLLVSLGFDDLAAPFVEVLVPQLIAA